MATTNEFRKIKIRLLSSTQSAAIQEFLFTQGCRWNTGSEVKHEEAKYLFVEASGSIGWDNNKKFFDRSSSYKEMTFVTEMKAIVTGHKLKDRPTVVVLGKTYFEDELADRLADLKVAK